MFISLMVSELSLYDGLVQYGFHVRGINRSQVFSGNLLVAVTHHTKAEPLHVQLLA